MPILPNFLIIGTGRAGSSWLNSCLNEHPDIFMYQDELRFFDINYKKGVEWYKSHFQEWAGELIVGEKSPHYLASDHAPQRIRHVLGKDVNLIAVLRHPVDRVYSNYLRFIRNGVLPVKTDFEKFYFENTYLRDEGLYFQHLQRYLKYFSKDRLLVLLFEENIIRNRVNTLATCFQFLGVSLDLIPKRVDVKINASKDPRIFARHAYKFRKVIKTFPPPVENKLIEYGKRFFVRIPKKGNAEKLEDDLRQNLLSEFDDDINQLESLLKRGLSVWRSPSG
jgi:hypothetical protein